MLYEYQCDNCGHIIERRGHIEESVKYMECACSEQSSVKHEFKRIISTAPAIHFKGGGWAKDNYDKKSKKKESSAKKDSKR